MKEETYTCECGKSFNKIRGMTGHQSQLHFHVKRLVDMEISRKDFGELVKPSYDTSLLTRRGRKVARRSEACTLRHSKMHHCKQHDSVHHFGHLA